MTVFSTQFVLILLTIPNAAYDLLAGYGGEQRPVIKNKQNAAIAPVTPTPSKYENDMYIGLVTTQVVVDLSASASGRIESLTVRAGDQVSKGDCLVRIDSSRLRLDLAYLEAEAKADKSVKRAELSVEKSKRDMSRVERLREGSAATVSEEQDVHFKLAAAQIELEEAKQRQEVRKAQKSRIENEIGLRVIRSPVTGIVEYVYGSAGGFVSEGQPILSVVSQDHIAEVMVPLASTETIGVGSRGLLILDNGTSVEGRVTAIAPTADPLTGMVRVTMWSEKLKMIRAGQRVFVRMTSTRGRANP